jgi:hypothetical protein
VPPRFAFGLIARQSLLQVFLDQHLDVKRQLRIEVLVDGPAPEQVGEA